MTAVEWLMTELSMGLKIAIANKLQKAKAMEKKQIIEAYDSGLFDGSMDDVNDRLFENYYQETYNKSKTPPGAHCEEA